jgi:dimethylaniline monooxygenase (N-oxide forming)
VIGAGPSGLAAAKELLAEGHEVRCFERREGLGGVFRYSQDPAVVGVWENCSLTSSEAVTSFSDHYPGCGDERPYRHRQMSHREYVEYLIGYAKRFGVWDRIEFGREVTAVSRYGEGWEVSARAVGSDESIRERFDAVAVCSGVHRVPHYPQLPGLSSFRGQVLHAAHYKGPSSIAGRSAVFVGAGESGGDIVGEAAPRLERAYLSLRRGVFVLPRLLNGVPNDYTGTRLLYSLPPFLFRRSDPAALRLRRRLGLGLLPVTALRSLLDRLQQRRRPPAAALRPEVGALIERLRASAGGNQFETFATKTESFVEAVVDGRCELRGPIRAITADGVSFLDGGEARVDAIVLCTGFEPPSLPFAAPAVDLGALYRSCFDPAIGEGLCFLGFLRPPLGAIPPMAEMQSRWLARLLSGAVALPPRAAMEAEVAATRCHRSRFHRSVYDRLPTLVDYSTYMDALAETIGCKPRLVPLLRDPRLLYKLYAGPFTAAQYRLRGPHADPAAARRAILDPPAHARAARFVDLALAQLARPLGPARLRPALTLLGRRRWP